MADQKAIERQWATYLTAIQATVPCTLDEIQLLYRELFPGKQEVYLTYIIEDVHDFKVSIFEKNGVQRSYQDVCRAVEHAREEFFARYPRAADTCPKCGSTTGIPRSGGYPSDIGFRVEALGYYKTAGCMDDRSGFQRFCTACKHVWMASEKANNDEVFKFINARRDALFLGHWSHS